MIHLACVVRGQLDPVFSFKDEHKSEQDFKIIYNMIVQILKCSFSGLCKISNNNYSLSPNGV